MRHLLVFLATFSIVSCEGIATDSDDAGTEQGTAGTATGCTSDVIIGTSEPNNDGQLGEVCTPTDMPTNCLDGTFIRFADTDECICIATCSTLNLVQGQSCDENELYVCQTVTGISGGPFCTARSWDICGDASQTGDALDGTDGTDDTDGTTGGEETDGVTCKPDGIACDDDAECCSMTCFASGCG